jgi:hypothetical protein
MLEIGRHASAKHIPVGSEETALHILARNGLAMTCKFLFEKLDEQLIEHKLYVADNIELIAGNLNHNWIQ